MRTTISGCFPAAWPNTVRYLTFTTATEAERQEFMQALDKFDPHLAARHREKAVPQQKSAPYGADQTLLELYPDAKFIYLVRNPYAVFESTRSFFRNTLASIRLQSISDEELEHEILLNYRALYEHYEADKPSGSGGTPPSKCDSKSSSPIRSKRQRPSSEVVAGVISEQV